jgi:soluble lytic murein transglycosylase-like protein
MKQRGKPHWLWLLIWLLGGGHSGVVVAAGVYSFVDEHGVRHISNIPDDPRFRLVKVLPGRTGAPPERNFSNSIRYHRDIEIAAAEAGLPPALIHAVVSTESNYDSRAVSRKGAMGLMQLMPQTALNYGVKDPFDPQQNLRAGAIHLRELLDDFGRLPLALAAYNAGAGAVRRYRNSVPPYPETQDYVRKVLQRYASGGLP